MFIRNFENQKDKVKNNRKALFMKLLINYFQILALSKEVDLNWSTTVRGFFEAQSKVGDPSNQIFSFDCLLKATSFETDLIYLKLILIFFLPFMLIFLLFLFFCPLKMFGKKNLLENFISSVIITFFFVQPFNVYIAFAVISCKEIEKGQYFIMSYLTTPCFNNDHYFYVIFN